MARKSKSSENNENPEASEEDSSTRIEDETEAEATESTDVSPAVIEGEAIDVTASEGADAPKDPDPAGTGESEEPAEPEAEEQVEAEAEVGAEETAPEPEPAAPVPQDSTSSGSGASILALVVGGLVAGGIGYFASTLAPEPAQPVFDTTEIDESLSENAAMVSALESEIAELRATADMSSLESRLSELSQSVEGFSEAIAGIETEIADAASRLETQVSELDSRILALETAVPAASELATGDELAALRERIEGMVTEAEEQLAAAQDEAAQIARAAEEARQQAEAEAADARAAAAAREAELRAMAERQAALIELKSAIESGAPYSELLDTLGTVPDALAANAEDGVPTIQSLQSTFPAAARRVLAETDLVSEEASAGERFTAFLKRRTNARSLTPQEGDGPDAVLSRAEARLGDGDLSAAVSELDALSDEGKAALGDWLEQARTRLSAIEAVDQLSATN